MPIRRVVTGLNNAGRARVLIDEACPHVTESPGGEVTEIWSSSESPAAYEFKGDRAIFPMKHDSYFSLMVRKVLIQFRTMRI